MSNQKTYDQRALEIAEEMAKATPQGGDPETHLLLQVYANRFIPAARIAVEHIQEEVRLALPVSWSKGEKEAYLMLRCLIPTPEQPEKEAGEA